MPGLSEEIGQFLDAVALVGELQAHEAALIAASRADWAQLLHAERMADEDASDRLGRELVVMRRLRREIADEIAKIREREGLQILGGVAAPGGSQTTR